MYEKKYTRIKNFQESHQFCFMIFHHFEHGIQDFLEMLIEHIGKFHGFSRNFQNVTNFDELYLRAQAIFLSKLNFKSQVLPLSFKTGLFQAKSDHSQKS